MKRTWWILLGSVLALNLWSGPAEAKDLGPIVRDDCNAIAGDYGSGDAGKVLCWDRTYKTLMYWNGTQFVKADIKALGVLTPQMFGAKGDVVKDNTCSISASSTSLTCSAGKFTSKDVGKTIFVPKAGAGHSAPAAPTVTLKADSTSGQMTAGDHQYKFTRVYLDGTESAASSASSTVTTDGTHTVVAISEATPGCYGSRDCIMTALYRNSVASPSTFRYLTDFRNSETYYDAVPDASIASNRTAPSSDASFGYLKTTISIVNSSTNVTLANAAVTASSGQSWTMWGTDDTAALRVLDAAITSASQVLFPSGTYWIRPSPTYNLDTQTGDHNGTGDTVIQVKETVDTAIFQNGRSVCIDHNSNTQIGSNCFTISSVSGSRITIGSALGFDGYEYDYVYVSPANVSIFNLGKVSGTTKDDVAFLGYGATVQWMPDSNGWLWGDNDAKRPTIEGFYFLGSSTTGQPGQQHVFVSNTGLAGGGTKDGRMSHVRAERVWQLLFWGAGNDGWVLDNFECISVLACTQSGAAVGLPRYRHIETNFKIVGDPLGTDDAIALYGDLYDVSIGPGIIDKNFTGGIWESHYVANCVTMWTPGTGGVIDKVHLHDIDCLNSGGTMFGRGTVAEANDSRFINPNKSGFSIDTGNGGTGTITSMVLSNLTVNGAYDCFRITGAADTYLNSVMTNLTARNCSRDALRLEGQTGTILSNFSAYKFGQLVTGTGLTHQNNKQIDFGHLYTDGTGSQTGSTGIFNGAMSGVVHDARLMNATTGTGFWMANANVWVGPVEVRNIYASNNNYGFEMQGLTSSSFANGLFASNLKATGNLTADYRSNGPFQVNIADDGNGGTAATVTLWATGVGFNVLNCLDPQGCVPSISETAVYEGQRFTIVPQTTYPLHMDNITNQQRLNAERLDMVTGQAVTFVYNQGQWQQESQAQIAVGNLYAPVDTLNTTPYTVPGADTVSDFHFALACDATSGNITINLPALNTAYGFTSPNRGRLLSVVKIDSTAHTCILDPDSTESIGGASTLTLTSQYEAVVTIGQWGGGVDWRVLSHSYPFPSCPDSGGNHLNFASGALSCGTSSSGGGGSTASAAQPNVTTVNAGNAPYTALATDWKLICDVSAAGRTINLPAASTKQYYKIKVHGANTCTIHPAGTDTIEGVNANYTITLNNASIDLTSDGSAGWDVQ